MASLNNKDWFTEKHASQGSAFSMAIHEKLHEEHSEYQHLTIYATETFGNLMVIDGCVMLTDRDNFLYHEMMSHPALFAHTDPKQVVIIGGGDCGTLREVLKHPGVEAAHQIDIDERVTRLAERYFPTLCSANDDPRAHLHFEDGIRWMKNATRDSIDVIIIDSTDPVGPAEGLFSRDFYTDCYHALRTGGILVQQSESPLYHLTLIASIQDAMKQAGFLHTHSLPFPQPCYPSGWWSATLAGKGVRVDRFRQQDAENKPFKTLYYNAAIHQSAFAVPEFMRKLYE